MKKLHCFLVSLFAMYIVPFPNIACTGETNQLYKLFPATLFFHINRKMKLALISTPPPLSNFLETPTFSRLNIGWIQYNNTINSPLKEIFTLKKYPTLGIF
jgi:hypothetical protein